MNLGSITQSSSSCYVIEYRSAKLKCTCICKLPILKRISGELKTVAEVLLDEAATCRIPSSVKAMTPV